MNDSYHELVFNWNIFGAHNNVCSFSCLATRERTKEKVKAGEKWLEISSLG